MTAATEGFSLCVLCWRTRSESVIGNPAFCGPRSSELGIRRFLVLMRSILKVEFSWFNIRLLRMPCCPFSPPQCTPVLRKPGRPCPLSVSRFAMQVCRVEFRNLPESRRCQVKHDVVQDICLRHAPCSMHGYGELEPSFSL